MTNQLVNTLPASAAVELLPPGASISAEQVRTLAEVHAALIIAKAHGRDEDQAIARIKVACARAALADVAEYGWVQAGEVVEGPTIQLMEAIASRWGNLDWGIRELGREEGFSELEAYAVDLETNSRKRLLFRAYHWRDYSEGAGKALVKQGDIYASNAAFAHRRVRRCLEGVIPPDVVETALETCRLTVAKQGGDIGDRREASIASFAGLGVSEKMLTEHLGHSVQKATHGELVKLRKLYAAIRSGMVSAEDAFARGSAASMDERLAAAAQAAPVPGDQKDPKIDAGGRSAEAEPEAEPEPEPEPDPPSSDAGGDVVAGWVARVRAADVVQLGIYAEEAARWPVDEARTVAVKAAIKERTLGLASVEAQAAAEARVAKIEAARAAEKAEAAKAEKAAKAEAAHQREVAFREAARAAQDKSTQEAEAFEARAQAEFAAAAEAEKAEQAAAVAAKARAAAEAGLAQAHPSQHETPVVTTPGPLQRAMAQIDAAERVDQLDQIRAKVLLDWRPGQVRDDIVAAIAARVAELVGGTPESEPEPEPELGGVLTLVEFAERVNQAATVAALKDLAALARTRWAAGGEDLDKALECLETRRAALKTEKANKPTRGEIEAAWLERISRAEPDQLDEAMHAELMGLPTAGGLRKAVREAFFARIDLLHKTLIDRASSANSSAELDVLARAASAIAWPQARKAVEFEIGQRRTLLAG